MNDHYEIFGFSKNPLHHDLKADHRFIAKTKREVVGLLKTMLDNFNCQHIAIFMVNEVKE